MDSHKSTHACVSLEVLPVLKCQMKRLTIKRTFGILCWTEKPIKAKQKHFDDGEKEDVCVVANGIFNTSETEIQQPKRSSLCQHAKCGDQRHFHFSGLIHYSSHNRNSDRITCNAARQMRRNRAFGLLDILSPYNYFTARNSCFYATTELGIIAIIANIHSIDVILKYQFQVYIRPSGCNYCL